MQGQGLLPHVLVILNDVCLYGIAVHVSTVCVLASTLSCLNCMANVHMRTSILKDSSSVQR
jgi:hypothetical protein